MSDAANAGDLPSVCLARNRTCPLRTAVCCGCQSSTETREGRDIAVVWQAQAERDLATGLLINGDATQAATVLETALKTIEAVPEDNSNRASDFERGQLNFAMARVKESLQDLDGAIDYYSRALSLFVRLVQDYPDDVSYRSLLATTLIRSAALAFSQGKSQVAIEQLATAQTQVSEVLKLDPDHAEALSMRTHCQSSRNRFDWHLSKLRPLHQNLLTAKTNQTQQIPCSLGNPTTMTEERIEAIQTRWSLIRNAHLQGQPESAGEARRLLVMRYAPAIRRYLGGIVRDDEEANELSQDVMLRLMRGDFAGADPGRGRFRDLLKTALRNMVRTSWQKSGRRKTVDAELDLIGREDSAQDAEWTAQWRKSVLDNTWNRLLAEEGGKPGPAYHALETSNGIPRCQLGRTCRAAQPKNGNSDST